MMKVHRVTAETLVLVEPLIEQWLKAKHSHDTRQSIQEKVEASDWTLHAVVDGSKVIGVFALTINETPRGERYVSAPMAAGARAREWWRLMDETAEQVARQYGCTEIMSECRPGWEKLMSGRYEKCRIVLRRKLA